MHIYRDRFSLLFRLVHNLQMRVLLTTNTHRKLRNGALTWVSVPVYYFFTMQMILVLATRRRAHGENQGPCHDIFHLIFEGIENHYASSF